MNDSMKTYENEIYQYVDRLKDLVSSKMWENLLMDCTKNELFILWLLYRQGEVNMTQVAEYIDIPLNTATGIIGRMEKRGLVIRARSKEDKRVVTLRLDVKGSEQIQDMMKEIMFYVGKVMESFDKEEVKLLMKLFQKVTDVMAESRNRDEKPRIRKITIE